MSLEQKQNEQTFIVNPEGILIEVPNNGVMQVTISYEIPGSSKESETTVTFRVSTNFIGSGAEGDELYVKPATMGKKHPTIVINPEYLGKVLKSQLVDYMTAIQSKDVIYRKVNIVVYDTPKWEQRKGLNPRLHVNVGQRGEIAYTGSSLRELGVYELKCGDSFTGRVENVQAIQNNGVYFKCYLTEMDNVGMDNDILAIEGTEQPSIFMVFGTCFKSNKYVNSNSAVLGLVRHLVDSIKMDALKFSVIFTPIWLQGDYYKPCIVAQIEGILESKSVVTSISTPSAKLAVSQKDKKDKKDKKGKFTLRKEKPALTTLVPPVPKPNNPSDSKNPLATWEELDNITLNIAGQNVVYGVPEDAKADSTLEEIKTALVDLIKLRKQHRAEQAQLKRLMLLRAQQMEISRLQKLKPQLQNFEGSENTKGSENEGDINSKDIEDDTDVKSETDEIFTKYAEKKASLLQLLKPDETWYFCRELTAEELDDMLSGKTPAEREKFLKDLAEANLKEEQEIMAERAARLFGDVLDEVVWDLKRLNKEQREEYFKYFLVSDDLKAELIVKADKLKAKGY